MAITLDQGVKKSTESHASRHQPAGLVVSSSMPNDEEP